METIYNPYLNRFEKYNYKHYRKTDIYNNQLYKIKDNVKQNILCHDKYDLSDIEKRIQKGELPSFTDSSLKRNFYLENENEMSIVVNNTIIKKEQWIAIFKNPRNPLIASFIESLSLNHWTHLSGIKEAVPLLALHLDKVNWNYLTTNPNPAVIPILINNWEKVDKMFFCTNPNILPYLEQNPDKINWVFFGWNLSIYEPDYENIRKRANIFKKELLEAAFHPRRVTRMMEYARGEPSSLDFLFLEKWANIFKEELIQKVLHPRRIAKLIEITENLELDYYI